MAVNNQKLKILHLLRMLRTETDPTHGLTMEQLLQRLADLGLEAERKAVGRDLSTLCAAGFPVKKLATAPVQYTLDRGTLSMSDVMLLVDTVQACRFLSEHQSDELTEGLKGLVSERERNVLDRRVHVEDRVVGRGDPVFHNIDVINQALAERKKLSLFNSKLDTAGQVRMTREKPYVVTPIAISFRDGFYYLTTWDDEEDDTRMFRVDRLRLVSVSDEPATRNSRIAEYRFDQEHRVFDSWEGEKVSVSLRVKAALMDAVSDTFGDNMHIVRHTPEEAVVRVKVQESVRFYGWIAGMSGTIVPEAPKAFVGRYYDWLRGLLADEAGESGADAAAAAAGAEAGLGAEAE